MLVMDHKANERKEFKIIRDYYSEKRGREGIMFVLTDDSGEQTVSKFLPKHQMNNNFEWERVRSGDVHYISAGIEYGDEPKLIVETGFINAKTKLFKTKRIYTYRKFTFILNEEDVQRKKEL